MKRRNRRGSRRRIVAVVGLTVAMLVGGALSAPFVSASEQPATQAGGQASGFWQRVLQWYGIQPGGQTGTGTGTGTGAWPGGTGGGSNWPSWPGGTGTGNWPSWPSLPGGGGSGGSGGSGSGGSGGSGAGSSSCPSVELVFARGTGEAQGLGIVGTPLARALASALPGRTVGSYAVVYAADFSQASAGPGATDMSNHISSVSASCPNTRFVIGGYSQGATVTDIAIGIRAGSTTGTAIPANLAPRVAAVVVFGNPLGLTGRTIAASSPTYGPRAKEFCNTGDPVCGGGGNFMAHLAYATDGSVTAAAQFAAGKVTGS